MFKSSTNQSIDLIGFSSSFYMKQFGLFMSDCIMLPKKLEVIYVIKIFTYKMGDLSVISLRLIRTDRKFLRNLNLNEINL
jgi:hypothetical protein